ncbi:MAG: hypothetical protein OJJ54_09120 [Pseudonocardia sp.]|nr:hypothetical protein [Pseudonocardia sp.]
MAAAAFPELDHSENSSGQTLLYGDIRDADHLGAVVARFADLGLELVDLHRLPD